MSPSPVAQASRLPERDAGFQPAHPAPRTMEDLLADAEARLARFKAIAGYRTGTTGAWATQQADAAQTRVNERRQSIHERDAWRAHLAAGGSLFTRPSSTQEAAS